MSLNKRAIASRANGAKSRGPVSAAGKMRSSQNAIRHGFLAKSVLVKHENREAFQHILDYHVATFKPTDEVQLGLVEEMVSAHWRMRRAWTIESNLFDFELEKREEATGDQRIAASFSQLAGGNQLHLLDRYESRLHRMYQRSWKTLTALQEAQADQEDPELPNEPNELEPEPENQPIPNEPSSPNQEFMEEPMPNEPSSGADVPVCEESPDSAAQNPQTAEIPNEPNEQPAPPKAALPNEPKKPLKPVDPSRIQQSIPLEHVYKLVRGLSGTYRMERI